MSRDQGSDSSSGATGNGGADGMKDTPRPVKVVRYGAMAWVGEFSHKPGVVFGRDAKVVIQTDRGIELGEPIGAPREDGTCEPTVPRPQLQTYVKNSGPEFCRPRAGRILRAANEQDINENSHLNAHVCEDIANCAALAHQLELDMRIITAEHLLGGERIVFYFASPSRVDFRQLVRELAQRYRTRIEMRQVGARDEARLVADYEVCGRECCCKNFLKKLRPVNMKMAKLQKSTLDPSKVSGRCGRLRCCLRYEHCGYEELTDRLPRVGSRVDTGLGPATVLDRQVLTQLVSVRTDDNRLLTIPREEIRAFDLPPAPPPSEPEPAPVPPDAKNGAKTDSETGERAEKPRKSRRRRGRRAAEREAPDALAEQPPTPASERPAAVDEPAPPAAPGPAPAEANSGPPRAEPGPGPEVDTEGPAGRKTLADPGADTGGEAPREAPPADTAATTPEGSRKRRRRGRRRSRRASRRPPAGEGST